MFGQKVPSGEFKSGVVFADLCKYEGEYIYIYIYAQINMHLQVKYTHIYIHIKKIDIPYTNYTYFICIINVDVNIYKLYCIFCAPVHMI